MTTRQDDSMAEIFRDIYLDRSSGVVERQSRQRLFFRGGELFLDRCHPCAEALLQSLACISAGSDSRPATHPELSRQTLELARELASTDSLGQLDRGENDFPGDLVGPLPTVLMVMELAVHGCAERDLLDRLGGEDAQFQSSTVTPALQQLPGLDTDMAGVLTFLAQPAAVAQLRSCSGLDRLSALRGLVKLRSVGLVTEVSGARSESRSRQTEASNELLSPMTLERFTDRIAEDLGTSALDLPAEEHRAYLADLVSRVGQINHYELLGIDLHADDDEVLTAYRRLARRVHPLHVRTLGLQDMEGVVLLLFERATEAYLTLSEPQRRVSYNRQAGVELEVTVDSEQREKEKRSMARQNYRLAVQYMSASSMEYSGAVELMQEATRLDPRPEYYVLLSKAQAKNPRWYADAVASLRRAVDLDPGNAGIRCAMGSLLETTGDPEKARAEYQRALNLDSEHPKALEALERLGGGSKTLRFFPGLRSKGSPRSASAGACR